MEGRGDKTPSLTLSSVEKGSFKYYQCEDMFIQTYSYKFREEKWRLVEGVTQLFKKMSWTCCNVAKFLHCSIFRSSNLPDRTDPATSQIK